MRKVYLFSLLIVILCSYSTAQDIDTTLYLEDIVIQQNRLSLPVSETARNIEIIDRQEIESLPVTNISELLQYTGGVDIRRRGVNGVQSDAGIRGGTFNQVQILINGAKMNDPQTGHHMMNLPVSLEDIERVEVIKGPAARIYGQNAFSGVINIITKKNIGDDLKVSLAGSYSSFQTVQGDLNIKVPSEYYDQSITLSRVKSEGYRYNTDYDNKTVFYQGNIRNIGNGLQINAGYTDRRFGANGFYANEKFVDQYEEVQTSFVSATTLFSSGNLTIRPRLSWRHNVDSYVFLRHNPSFFMNHHTGNSYNGQLHFSYNSGIGVTGFGVDVTAQTLVSNNLGDRSRTIAGLFAEHRFSLLSDRLRITPGLYLNKITDLDVKIYPGIDVAYDVNNNIGLFATANMSDRIPTYTNLYYTSRAEQGNPNLKAESATAIEAGLKYNTARTSITLSAWYRDNRNLIDWVKDSTEQVKWLALNFSEVKMTGIDLNSKYKLYDVFGDDYHMDITADYTYIKASITDDDQQNKISRYALDNLRHQLVLGLNTTLLPKHLYLATYARYADRVSLKDYTLLDVKLMYRSKRFETYFSVNNITDTVYRETNLVTMPGRWFSLGVKLKS